MQNIPHIVEDSGQLVYQFPLNPLNNAQESEELRILISTIYSYR